MTGRTIADTRLLVTGANRGPRADLALFTRPAAGFIQAAAR